MSHRPTEASQGAALTRPLRIANCSGFYGDRLSAAAEMVNDGPIDVLTGDWLAELTMLILAKARLRRPNGGYATTFVRQMEQVMGSCLDQGIKVVANAGGLDPKGCAEAVAEVAESLGLTPSIAYVTGDDLLPRLNQLATEGTPMVDRRSGDPITDSSGLITANAYLGCWGIADALAGGADIVITGRTTDAAIVCGPAAWHHGWSETDYDQLAGAVVAGHIIECGTQATGGNYSFFTEVPGMGRTGFPWADVAADGSSVIGKHDNTGGEVSIGTVTSQLLYEIDSPRYLGPDVTARFDTIELNELDKDRIAVTGVWGEPPPSTLKVSINEVGGYRSDLGVALTGLDIEAKAELVTEAFWLACPLKRANFDEVDIRVVRTDKADPATNEEAVAQWLLTVKDADEAKLGRALRSTINELALATIPGMFASSGGAGVKPFGVHRVGLVPTTAVPQYVTPLGDATRRVPPLQPPEARPSPRERHRGEPANDLGLGLETTKLSYRPLGTLIGARSGDKGGNANLGLFARSDRAFAWLDDFLTIEQLRLLLPEVAELPIDRYRLPNLRSLNFVIHGLLGDGVAASTRQDAQAKSLGEWVRARQVPIPVTLLSAP